MITRSRPPCSHTNSRPSGANCIAVGLFKPLATSASVKPAGRVAARLGVKKETLSRLLRELGGRGLISVERREVRILDREGLAAVTR